ncbi:MAG: sensor domain-containing diguanylate cyclase, partial [Pseudomonadota bacterium]
MTNPISTADRFAARFLLILLPFFALVLLAALWSAALYQLSQERNAGIKETLAKSQFLTRTFAEHSIHMLHQVDHASQLFKLTSEALDNQLSLRDFTRKDGVLNHVLPPELNMVISVIDRHGTVIDSTQPFKPVNFSTQEFFKVLAARTTDSLFVNTLVTDPELHRWVIQLSRRFNARDGSFAGIVLFSIEPTYFIEDFDTAELGANGAVSFFSPEEKLSITRVSDQIVFSSLTDFLPLP